MNDLVPLQKQKSPKSIYGFELLILVSGAAGLPAGTPKEWSCRESNPGPEKINACVLHA